MHSRNTELTVSNGEDDRWMRDLGSDVGGEQKGYSSRKLISFLLLPRADIDSITSTALSPPSFSGIAIHSHVSLVVAADFLDSDVVLGVNERLSGGVGFCHGYYAGHVPEVVLVLNFDLDCQNTGKSDKEQKEQECFVSRSHLCA